MALGKEPGVVIEGPDVAADGIFTYRVTSPYQRKTNAVEVLLPGKMSEGKRYPVLYILPVNDGTDGPWGSGIHEAKRCSIHNKYGVICVAPAYDETPWFGDNPTDPTLRQESYLLRIVIPLIEDRYRTIDSKEGRFLIGFSKSGFGATAIFLRHLDVFGRAAAWDAPLTSKTILKEEDEMRCVFDTEDNYRGYYIPGLIDLHAELLRNGPPRIVLVNNGVRATPIVEVHEQLTTLGIPHRYLADAQREHNWTSGWFRVAAKLLLDAKPMK
jgi:S-formylglutathione hydrolase FrmB